MNFIIFCLFWFVGLIFASFTLIPILIILRFGIGATQNLERRKLIKPGNGIIGRYKISITILTIIFITIVIVAQAIFPNGFLGLLIGVASSLLTGFSKTGRNMANINDYVLMNKKYFVADEAIVRSSL